MVMLNHILAAYVGGKNGAQFSGQEGQGAHMRAIAVQHTQIGQDCHKAFSMKFTGTSKN